MAFSLLVFITFFSVQSGFSSSETLPVCVWFLFCFVFFHPPADIKLVLGFIELSSSFSLFSSLLPPLFTRGIDTDTQAKD